MLVCVCVCVLLLLLVANSLVRFGGRGGVGVWEVDSNGGSACGDVSAAHAHGTGGRLGL